jgi:dipeptidyl aminopeptidase/acylaminoacyl peptidase
MAGPVLRARLCARARVIADAQLSPEGNRVSAVVRTMGRAELVVVPAGGGAELVLSGDPDVPGAHPAGGGAHCWTPDGAGLVYVGREGGLWRVPAGGGTASPVGPGPEDGAELWSPAVSPDGATLVWVEDGRRVAAAPLGGPGPQGGRAAALLTDPEPDFVLDPVVSPDSARVAWVEWDVPAMPWDSSRLVVADRGTGRRRVVAGGEAEAVQQPRFAPTGRLGWISDATGWANVWAEGQRGGAAAPVLDEPFEHAEPAWGPGQRSWCWSPDGGAVGACRNEGGFARLVVAPASGAGHGSPVRELGRGWHHGLGWAGERMVAVRSGARTPTTLVGIDPADGARTPLVRGPLGGVEGPWLVEPEPVEWQADDGARLPGRLYRPPGQEAPAGLIMWIHGGPTGQMTVTFNPRVAFFVSRGWAVLVPDHRGSTGWGRFHAQGLAGGWGVVDVADCAAGLRAAADTGWAAAGSAVVMGASAGGMTALLLLALHPELCAAGVDLYGVADLEALAATTHRFEAHYTHSLVGPLPAAADLHRRRSPLAVAERIRSPLLILHGSDDPVVPLAQSLALRDRTLAAGNRTEMHVYEGEGHGWSRPETVEDELNRTAEFLDRHGRPPG